MNKILRKIATGIVGIAMAIGVGVAIGSGAKGVTRVHAATTTDTITADDLNATGSSYVSFEVTKTATYIGYSAKNSSNMQFNKNGTPTNRCIATSVSGGTIKSVSVTYGNANNNTITVYGSNSAYSITASFNTGTSLGTLSSNTQTVTVTGSYSHVALFPSGATYPSSISFEWTTTAAKTLSSIALSGTYPTTFTQGDSFSHSGMTVTATYSDSTTANVTSSATFSGYNMSTTGNQTVTVSYTEGGTTKTATYGITVNAPVDYTITYNANGGTGTVPSSTVGHGSISLPSSASLTKSGYVLDGWGDSSHKDDTTAQYSLGASYNLSASTTLYAHWTRVYTVSFDANGGSGTMASVPDVHGSYTLPSSSFTAPGTKSFAGWKANNTGDLIAAGQSYTVSADVKFYAQWANITTEAITVSDTDDYVSGTATNQWVTFTLSKSSGAEYYIRSMGTNGSTTEAIRWNTNGYLVCTESGGTIKSITITTTSDKSINIYAKDSAYSEEAPSGTSITSITAKSTGTTYTFTSDYSYFALKGGASSIVITQISIVWQMPERNPEIKSVTVNGGPEASSTIDGGSTFDISATVETLYDFESQLDTRVSWSVTPAGAVSFSKTVSDSDEEITVTAANVNNASVKITATSVAEGFTDKKGDSNTFAVSKVYVVTSVSLSVTTPGGPTFDGDSEESIDISFTTSVNYSGDTGSNKVNITASPNTGVSGLADNVTAGAFTLTFTKNSTYTITSTSAENNTKSASVTITITNLFKDGYELITSVASLRNGSKAIIGSTGKGRIMGTTMASSLIAGISYTVSDEFIPIEDVSSSFGVWDMSYSDADGEWEFTTTISGVKKWLACDGDANRADLDSSSSNATKWSLTFDSDGNCTLNPKNYSGRQLMANSGNSNFGCYTGTQTKIQLYQKTDNSPYFTINTQSVYLGSRGTQDLTLVAHNKATDTVTWSISGDNVVSLSSLSGLSTTITASASDAGVATVTATFASGDFDPISVRVEVMELDMYVTVGVTKFTRVNEEPTGGWEGTYLIVDTSASAIFDGSASPLSATSQKSISAPGNEINATSELIASSFNIKESTNGYTIRSNSNYFFGNPDASDKNINTSLGEEYEVSITSGGIITGLTSTGATTNTTLRHVSGDKIWRFYNGATGNAPTLYKADGEVRAITDTITDWYDNAKDNNYLVCDMGGESSKINWTGLSSGTFFTALTTDDLDTLKRMTAKSAEDNGNYLEDFISDYDYLVEHKGYTDFLHRFDEGGAKAGHTIYRPRVLFSAEKTNAALIVVITSVVTGLAIGGYFFLHKKKED